MTTHDRGTEWLRTERRATKDDGAFATTSRSATKRHNTPPGVLFAVAAVTVTAPRLALAFLAADGVVVPTSWRIDLLAVASIASAVVLTGGTAYLAHAIAVARAGRGTLVALWAAALVCSGALIAPAIVATLRAEALSAVLGTQRHWGWSICAVLAIDLVTSGAMLADARRSDVDRVSDPVQPPVEGVDTPTFTPLPAELPHPCPWGCGRRFSTRDAANGHGSHRPVLAVRRAGGAVSASQAGRTADRHDGDAARRS